MTSSSQPSWQGPFIKPRSHELRLGRALALRTLYAIDLSQSPVPYTAWRSCVEQFYNHEITHIQPDLFAPEDVPETDEDDEDAVEHLEDIFAHDPDRDLRFASRIYPKNVNWERTQDIALHWLEHIARNRSSIDATIRASSPRWRIQRMQPIERNILRIGTFEFTHVQPLSPRETVYDCVELAKTFGDARTHRFVNGILDQICKDNNISLRRSSTRS